MAYVYGVAGHLIATYPLKNVSVLNYFKHIVTEL